MNFKCGRVTVCISGDPVILYRWARKQLWGEITHAYAWGIPNDAKPNVVFYSCDEKRNTRVLVELPENGTHFQVLPRMADALKQKAKERNIAIVVVTFSPILLDCFDPEDVLVIEQDGSGGLVVRPLDLRRVMAWLGTDAYSGLGELWVRGFLGAMPAPRIEKEEKA